MSNNIKLLFATVHQRFLEHQTAVHREYLNLQQRVYQKSFQHFSNEKPRPHAPQKYKVKRADFTGQKIYHKYQFDPSKELWIYDHRPMFTRPALPMMSIVDIMGSQCAEYFPGKKLVAIKEVRVAQWAILDKPKTITVAISIIDHEHAQVTLSLTDKAKTTQIAKGKVVYAESYPQPAAPPETVTTGAIETPDPYRYLFHGPAFQVVRKLIFGDAGSTMILDASQPLGPLGRLNHSLLDGVTQGVYHEDGLCFWSDDLPKNHVCFPALMRSMNVYSETPTQGTVRCETRFLGFHYTKAFPIFKTYLIRDENIWAEMELIYAVLPMGFMGMGNNENKYSFNNFVKGKIYSPAVYLAINNRLKIETMKDVKQSQWFPHLLEDVYEIDEHIDIEGLTQQVLIKDVFAAKLKVHPSAVQIINEHTVMQKNQPEKYNYKCYRNEDEFIVEV